MSSSDKTILAALQLVQKWPGDGYHAPGAETTAGHGARIGSRPECAIDRLC